MSISTMTVRRLPKPSEIKEVMDFPSGVEDSGTLVNEIIKEWSKSLNRSGFPQPSVEPGWQGYGEMESPSLVVVASGIAVQVHEYEERYSGIDLEYHREHMSPEMFKAFVRHIGSIRGRKDLNIGEFVNPTEM